MIGAERRGTWPRSRGSRRRPDKIVGEARRLRRPPRAALGARPQSTVSVAYATDNSSATRGSSCCNYDYVGAARHAQLRPRRDHQDRARARSCDCPDGATASGPSHSSLNTPVNATIARASARVSIVDSSTGRRNADAVRAQRGGRREGRARPRLGAARRPGRPDLQQHGHGRLHDARRHAPARASTTRALGRHAQLRAGPDGRRRSPYRSPTTATPSRRRASPST